MRGDFFDGVEQLGFLNGDDGLRGQRFEHVLIVDGESGHARTFDVEHAFQSAAGAKQRHGQFRAHFVVGVKGPINLGPRRLVQIINANGLAMQRGPAHDAAVFADGQTYFGIFFSAADRARSCATDSWTCSSKPNDP